MWEIMGEEGNSRFAARADSVPPPEIGETRSPDRDWSEREEKEAAEDRALLEGFGAHLVQREEAGERLAGLCRAGCSIGERP